MARMKALWHAVVVPAMLMSASPATGPNTYDVDSLKSFREGREKALLAEDGWFTVAGLHFLSPGEKRYFAEATSAAAVQRK